MKIRILSALVGIVLLIGLLICPWTWVLALAAAVLAALAVWELCHKTGKVQSVMLTVVNAVFAAIGVGLMYLYRLSANSYYGTVFRSYDKLLLSAMCLFPLILSAITLILWLIGRKKVSFTDVCYGYLMTLYATIGFGSLASLRVFNGADRGIWYILLVLIIPWMSDTGAYFVGSLIGKHKMAPVISPKKTWEGFVGGWLVSMGCAALYAVLCSALVIEINVLTAVLLAFVLSPLSVCGDLLASYIKRSSNIKDYGNLMPGHGGVMDRFDSVILIAPLLYVFAMQYGYWMI